MNSKSPSQSRPAPRLYLGIPASIEAIDRDLLTDIDIAAVLLRLPNAESRALLTRIKAFASAVQPSGAALLIDGRADLVARGGADGAHLIGVTALQETLATLKPQRIAGAGGLVSRHDAMVAGEAGADYVLFGEPVEGDRPSIEAVAERVAWWAEVFEIPCVGYAGSVAEAAAIAAAGSDFIMLEDCIWSDLRGERAALLDAVRAIGQGRAPQ